MVKIDFKNFTKKIHLTAGFLILKKMLSYIKKSKLIVESER